MPTNFAERELDNPLDDGDTLLQRSLLDRDSQFDGESDEDDSLAEARKKHTSSNMGTVFNFVCVCVGSGILSLPTALVECGWFGIFLMLLVAWCSNSTAKMLIECIHVKPSLKLQNYEDIGEACLGTRGRIVVGVMQSVTLTGICTIFLILIGLNMHSLLPHVGTHVWVLIAGGVLIPVAWIPQMSELQYLSLFGAAASVIVAGSIVYKGLYQGGQPTELAHNITVNNTTYIVNSTAVNRVMFKGSGLPVGFNVIVYSFGFHAVLPHIERMMTVRKDFNKVSNISVGVIVFLYTSVAVAGYYGYGDKAESNILVSMGGGALSDLCRALISLHVFLAYPIPLNPVSLALESAIGISKMEGARQTTSRIVLRTALVFLTMTLATLIPYFGEMLSLISAVSVVFTAFVFPPLFLAILRYKHGQLPPTYQLVYMLFVFVLGCVAGTAGTYFAISDLIDAIRLHPNPFQNFWSS